MNNFNDILYYTTGKTVDGIIEKMIPNQLKGINIEEEYKLIQQKKSKLSRNLRDLVVELYERRK